MTRTLGSVRRSLSAFGCRLGSQTEEADSDSVAMTDEDRPGGLELKELEDFVVSLGHKKFHAKQIYQWIWKARRQRLRG
jgi:hypothetical protein